MSIKKNQIVENPCYGCGKGAPVENYFSHRMTDGEGPDGEAWGDAALVLCAKCCDATQDICNVSEFRAYAKKRGFASRS